MEEFIFLNLIYFIFVCFTIFPSTEVVSVGLSIPTLFSTVLGSEQMFFIYYHMLRILITLCVQSLLPLGYFVFMGLFSDLNLFDFVNLSRYWSLYLKCSILFAVLILTICYYWKQNNFNNHPVAVKLKKFSANWNQIANQINVEFRRIDKFQAGSLFSRVYVTDNWLIKVSLYSIDLCPNDTIDLTLTHANEVNLTQDGSPSTQYLHILVKSTDNKIKPFYIRLNSFEYKDFNDKLNKPIREACSIIIKQSLPDQFLDAFRQQISENVSLNLKRDEVETCVGCMRKLADVKLIKSCDNTGDCNECYCRPMWCIECLGKWFAYRQDQNQPNTWLSSKATCATCRAKFCILDVAMINFID